MRRAVRLTLAVVTVLALVAGLSVVAEELARREVTAEAQSRLESVDRISGSPKVDIGPRLVIPQLLDKRFEEVRVTGAELEGRLRLTAVEARLRGVTREPDSGVRVERLEGTAFVPFAEFQRAAGRPDLKLAWAGGDQLRVSAVPVVVGNRLPVTVRSRVTLLPGNRLQVRALDLNTPSVPILGAVFADLLRESLDLVFPVPELPPGVRLSAVRLERGGLRADIRGDAVLLKTR
jgi:hypothetical protein